jgi:hypothetical protein
MAKNMFLYRCECAGILLSMNEGHINVHIPTQEDLESRLQSSKKLILSSESYAATPFAQSQDERMYMFDIEKGDVRIVYVGSEHVHDSENKVFSEIRKKFDTLRPDVVYVEGIERLNTHPEQVTAALIKMSEENACNEGENIFTAKLAAHAGIPCYSPEPKFADEIAHIENSNFAHRDIFNFYVYQMVYQYQRMHQERKLEECVKYIKDFVKDFRRVSHWDDAEISSLEQSVLEELDLDNVEKYATAVDPIPWEHRTQTATNQISRASSSFRDEFIFEQIARGAQTHKKILVVYGSAHAVTQEPALRAFLASQ